MAIRIITDSACDIGRESQRGFELLPITVEIDDVPYLDGKNLSPADFYKLSDIKSVLRTSAVSQEQFSEIFKRYDEDTIVGVFISSKLSKTFSNAVAAKKALEREDIYLIDSGSVSVGLAMLVEGCVKLHDCGCDAGEIFRKVHGMADKLEIYAIFDTLKYLAKYGKITKSAAAAGAVMGVKSLVRIKNGKLESMGREMGFQRAIDLAVKTIQSKSKLDRNMPIGFSHSNNFSELERLIAKMGAGTVYLAGGATATHTGPGSIGVGFFNE